MQTPPPKENKKAQKISDSYGGPTPLSRDL